MNDNVYKLPILTPPIITKNNYAFPLIISLLNKENYDWFFSNWIQLMSYYNKNKFNLMFFRPFMNKLTSYPCIDTQTINKNVIYDINKDILEIIKYCIYNGYYIISSYDEFYIPNTQAFKKRHLEHDFMIYGLDEVNKKYYILGYCIENGVNKFGTNIVGFSDFYNGYISNLNTYKVGYSKFYIIKPNKNYTYKFDLNKVYEDLSDYLYSKDSFHNYRYFHNIDKKYTFGINIYHELDVYFSALLSKQIPYNDIRILSLFKEHKECMLLRVKYMIKNGYIDNNHELLKGLEFLKDMAINAFNLQIKYNFNNSHLAIDSLKLLLKNMLDKEQYLLFELIRIIETRL